MSDEAASPLAARSVPDSFHPSAASILATEHWSVLGSRSMMYNEAFSRASVFLNVLSAGVVALALAADATGFGEPFGMFALVLFPMVWFLGIATYVRLVQLNSEDVLQVIAMNRLRRGYLDIAPELETYFTSGWHDDLDGVVQTFSWGQPSMASRPLLQFLVTTPTVIGTIDAIVGASGAALVASRFGLALPGVILVGIVAFIVSWLALFSLQVRQLAKLKKVAGDSRFPSALAT